MEVSKVLNQMLLDGGFTEDITQEQKDWLKVFINTTEKLVRMKKMKIYQAVYVNDPESGYMTISVHKTKQGARDALAKFIVEEIRPREHRQQEGILDLYRRADALDKYKAHKMYTWLSYKITETELLK